VEAGDRIIVYADQETFRVELEMLAYLKRLARAMPGLEVGCVVRFGEAADEIVKEAQAARVDLIAMATHRRRGLDRALKGSVAETVERALGDPGRAGPVRSGASGVTEVGRPALHATRTAGREGA
jgi:nucleotide-binding universal stress UspA family protein